MAGRQAQMTRSELTELAAFKPREAGSQPVIKVHELRKRYGDLDAVRGITFDVAEGEIFGLIGPDGAGKTSTLQVLSGVMMPGRHSCVGGVPALHRAGAMIQLSRAPMVWNSRCCVNVEPIDTALI